MTESEEKPPDAIRIERVANGFIVIDSDRHEMRAEGIPRQSTYVHQDTRSIARQLRKWWGP